MKLLILYVTFCSFRNCSGKVLPSKVFKKLAVADVDCSYCAAGKIEFAHLLKVRMTDSFRDKVVSQSASEVIKLVQKIHVNIMKLPDLPPKASFADVSSALSTALPSSAFKLCKW